MTIWFTSDLHFGHKNMCAEGLNFCDRPFATVAEMNEALVTYWNETVGEHDTVYVLGDLAMGKIDDSLAWAAQLKGYKRLLPGNHDRCWVGNGAKHEKWIKPYADAGFPVTTEDHIVHIGRWFDLSHFPYSGDSEDEDRYPEFRPEDKGEWLLHGHIHDMWVRKDRMINVGTDVWNYRPVSIDDLVEMREFYDE